MSSYRNNKENWSLYRHAIPSNQKTFTINLLSEGPNRICVLKYLKNKFEISYQNAKAILDDNRNRLHSLEYKETFIYETFSSEEAENIVKELNKLGANAMIV
jgi:ribosomal protein L7/L12